MAMCLSDKAKEGTLIILDKLEANEYKTKLFNQILNNLETKVLALKKKSVDSR